MRSLVRRLQYMLRRRQHQAELDEEMAFHRELLAQRSAFDGEAAKAFGNATLAREDARGVWIAPSIESVWQDVVYAVRSLRRQPAFSACAIVIVALGTGTATGVFSLLDHLVVRSLPVERPDRLVWFRSPSFSYPIFKDVQDRVAVFDGFFGWNLDRAYVDWSGNGTDLIARDLLEATPAFFTTLGVKATAGRTFAEGDTFVAVLSHRAWTRHFGADPSAIGRTIRIATQPYTIIGVTPPEFFGVAPGLDPEIFVPIHGRHPASAFASTTSSWLHLMGRLKDGVSFEQANAALQAAWPSIMEATTSASMSAERRAMFMSRRTALEPGRTGFSRVRNQFGDPLRLLMGLVIVLLAIGCASLANLLLARGVARRREIAIRIAIGASRRRVFRQLVTEALVVTIVGAAAGLVLASWSIAAIVNALRTSTNGLTIDASLDWRALGFIAILAIAVSIVAAWFPSLRATRVVSRDALREGQPGGALLRRLSLGRVLVGVQVALAVVLVAAAAVFGRSLAHVLGQGASMDGRKVIVVSPDAVAAGLDGPAVDRFHAALLERLKTVPGVESAALAWKPPISYPGGSWTQTVAVDGGPPMREDTPSVYFNSVSAGYFTTVGLALRRGRDISASDTADAPFVTVVNEALVQHFFAGQDPIGHRIGIGLAPALQRVEIVGVVQDAKYRLLQEPQRNIAYLSVAQHAILRTGGNQNLVVVARTAVAGAAASLRQAARDTDARVPIRIESVADRIRESTINERMLAALATGLGLIALTLASAGLYGLLAYAVSRHVREIGLRIALGARPGAVLWMVQRESLLLGAVGIVAGLAISLALGRYAASLLFQTTPADPVALAGAAAIMLLVTACAAFLPARRAALVDPLVALKTDN